MKLIEKEAMKDVDARLIKDMGFPETVLIENAGRAVAEEACAFLGGAARKRIVLLCGKGNNGGDGLAALRFCRVLALPAPLSLRLSRNRWERLLRQNL